MKAGVVFDCMIFLQAASRVRGPSAACVSTAEAGEFELFVSAAVLDELRDVLNRPRLRRKFPLLTDVAVSEFLARLMSFARLLDPVPATFSLKRDPKDSKYLDLAIATSSEIIVSWDNDLLGLMAGTDAEAVAFRTTYCSIRILNPVAFLQLMSAAPPPSPGNP